MMRASFVLYGVMGNCFLLASSGVMLHLQHLNGAGYCLIGAGIADMLGVVSAIILSPGTEKKDDYKCRPALPGQSVETASRGS